jgi:type IX secretion system PorP/SprF family membrane protein
MKKISAHIILCLFLFLSAKAQDLHFSQYFANPISYNPATTGFFDGNYRLGVNHKQQWPWAIKGKFLNYNSSSAHADFAVADKKINKTDWIGIGFNFINDQAGDGNLSANKAYFSFAYHKGLDKKHMHHLSAGFTLGYVHRSVNFSALYFNNQWVDRVGFDLSIPNGENLNRENTGYLDLGAGIQSSNKINERVTLINGFSMLHINRPKETFYMQDNRLGMRFLTHSLVEYRISKTFEMQFSGYFTYQKKAHETLFGTLAGASTHNNPQAKTSKIFFGTFYRWGDALSPIFGYQYHKTRLLMNYDVNLSNLTAVSRGVGGFELSLMHVGSWGNDKYGQKRVNCPTF